MLCSECVGAVDSFNMDPEALEILIFQQLRKTLSRPEVSLD